MGILLDSHSDYLENAYQKEKKKKRGSYREDRNPCVRTWQWQRKNSRPEEQCLHSGGHRDSEAQGEEEAE